MSIRGIVDLVLPFLFYAQRQEKCYKDKIITLNTSSVCNIVKIELVIHFTKYITGLTKVKQYNNL